MKTDNSKKRSKPSKTSSKNTPKERKNSLSEKVLRFAKKEQLWSTGDTIILGVSGGPDSVCLLHIFLQLAKKERLRLVVAHVNYQLRQKDSDNDERLVAKLAKDHQLPYFSHRPTNLPTKNREAAFRAIRYDFFEQVRRQEKGHWIAVGHQEDDQAETFLLRLLRGSGATGLQGMRPKHHSIIRPLLETSRESILTYLKKKELPYRLDESNSSPEYTRNKIRHILIPLLKKDFQPNIGPLLARTARLLGETTPDTALLTIPVASTPSSRSFSLIPLLPLPDASIALFLRGLLSELLPYPPSQALVQEIIKVLKSSKNKRQKMDFRGLKLERKGARVTLQKISNLD